MKTKESMVSDLENEMDDEMSKSGVYSQGIEGMMAASEFKNSLGEENEIDEKWSKKYKDSIDCKNPKGFSQKAHCQGKNKKTETDESTGSGSAGGFSAPLFSTTKQEMQEKCWPGYQQKGMKKKGGRMVPNCVNESVKEKEKDNKKKYLDIEDMIPELKKQLNKGTRLDKDIKKVEATEATGSGSSGQYSTTAVGLNQRVKKIGWENLNHKYQVGNLFKLRKNVKNSHTVIKVILKPLRYMRMRRLRKLLKILVKNTILVRM